MVFNGGCMELRELISFYHVARVRSVSKAARTLELGQPTVTTHLRKLEDEFGITLFDRIKENCMVPESRACTATISASDSSFATAIAGGCPGRVMRRGSSCKSRVIC